MDGSKMNRLDALIEAALRPDEELQAPPTLVAGVSERLRIAALRDREMRRFRVSLITLLLALSSALIAAGGYLWFTKLDVIARAGVSGGKGHYDYYATALGLSLGDYTGAYTLVLSLLLLAATIALGVRPLRRYLNYR